MLILLALIFLLPFHGVFAAGGNHPKASQFQSGLSSPKSHNQAEMSNEIIAQLGKFTVRMAKKEDSNEHLRELYKLFAEENNKIDEKKEDIDPIKLTNEQIGEHLEHKRMECFVVSHEDLPKNEFVAFAIYYFAASSVEGKIMHLEAFFIKPKYRREETKLADLIFLELAKKASENHVNSIEWTVPAKNVEEISFYNRQPNAVNLSKPEIGNFTKKHRINYYRFLIEKSNKILEKSAKIKGKNKLHVSITSIGKSCKKDGMAKQEVNPEELAKQWANLFGKSPSPLPWTAKNCLIAGSTILGPRHKGKHKKHEVDEGHFDKKLAELLNVNEENEKEHHRSLGSVTVKSKEGQIVGMALFHCNAYSTLTGPYIWLDNLMVDKSADLRKAGTLIFGELAKIGSDLGAERIEWMAPGFGPSEGASSSNNSPSPNDFPGHVTFFDEIGAINLTADYNGGWLIYHWPKEGFEAKIKEGMDQMGSK